MRPFKVCSLLIAMLVLGAATPLAIGQSTPPPPPAPQPTPRAPRAPEPEDRRPAPLGQPVNVKIDVTITDERGTGKPVTKTMSMTTGDREVGNIRTDAEVMLLAADANGPVITLPLNVDARPQILDSGKIRLSLSLQYDLVDASVERGIRPKTQIRESVSVILESGKPLVVTQSADPVSDRKVTVEVKATVLR